MNGRIECYKGRHGENVGPARVWLKHEQYPGLAMSRSIGDACAHSVGVSALPGKQSITSIYHIGQYTYYLITSLFFVCRNQGFLDR